MIYRRLTVAITVLIAAAAGTLFVSRFYLHPQATALPRRDFVDQLLGGKTVKVKPPDRVQIILVGDIMLSRNVAAAIKKAGDPGLPFEKIEQYLASSDLNFGNLESPIAPPICPPQTAGGCPGVSRDGRGSEGVVGGHSLIFGAPSDNVKGLSKNNFKVLSLANNHALDQGIKGLAYTKQLLSDNGILGIGAGENSEDAWQPAKIAFKDAVVCFLAASYASVNDGGKSRNDYVARVDDLDTLKTKISALKAGNCDIVIASQHAGNEYTRVPSQTQTDFARAAIDAGADVVVGAHPHWIQPVEKYGSGLIFHSLGNFIFDQEWSQKTKEGLTVRLTIEGGKPISAELVPVIIENYCCARLADDAESAQILREINATSTIIRF